MKKSLPLLLLVFLFCGLLLFLHKRAQGIQNTLRQELSILQDEVSTVKAKNKGLENAISALHVQLSLSKESAASAEDLQKTKTPVFSDEDIEASAEDPVPQQILKASSYPEPPTAAPTISPQLRNMMEQFPDHVSESSISSSNTIQEYYDANPELANELNKPAGEYGAGIEAVMKERPDLAEKVKKNESMPGFSDTMEETEVLSN